MNRYIDYSQEDEMTIGSILIEATAAIILHIQVAIFIVFGFFM